MTTTAPTTSSPSDGAPRSRLDSLLASHDELRRLHARVLHELDALAAQGFEGVEGLDRLRVWTTLVQSCRDLVDRLHPIREADVVVGEMLRLAVEDALDRLSATTATGLQKLVQEFDGDRSGDLKSAIDRFVSESLPIRAAVAAEGCLVAMRTRFGLFSLGPNDT